jgi:hypothetical protein
MGRKAFIMVVAGLFALVGSALYLAAAEWWEEEQTSLVQTKEGKDQDGNPYKVLTNWEDGYIKATGMGTADPRTTVNQAQALALAEDAARVRAYAQLAETVLGFNITSEITVDNGLVDKSEQKMRLEGFLKGARVLKDETKVEWLPDGSPSVEITVGIVMNLKHPGIDAPSPAPPKEEEKPRSLSQVLSPTIKDVEEKQREEKQVEVYVPSATASLPTDKGVEVAARKEGEEPPYEFPQGTEEKDYTGLIVDAHGLEGSPSLSPKIFSEYGKEVWGTMEVDPDWAFNYGIADFAHDKDTAAGKERAGDTPLVVTAIRVQGVLPDSAFKSDFFVSEQEANFIMKMNERAKSKDKDGKGFLEKCAVVFIL